MWQYFGIKDAIDVLITAAFLYQIYNLMRSSGSMSLFGGIFFFVVAWLITSRMLDMRLMGAILDKIISVGLIVLVVVFQEEIRRFLVSLGSNGWWHFLRRFLPKSSKKQMDAGLADVLVTAATNLSRKETGALIVIKRHMDLSTYIRTGEVFNADINARLIENIFFKNTPLHDGALIISNGRIRAASCILPVAQTDDLSKDLGLRHRAGLGLAIETDAFVIIVSEERSEISVAHNGHLSVNISAEELRDLL
ncbi:MAG: diadenylate cyclase CdaA [Tannerellaceae bacterium]|jgi:uncharacterized protein (TIGR00159 family)|nr:diadenylate cyclase CdaA [Tannerellaceae bacterium]